LHAVTTAQQSQNMFTKRHVSNSLQAFEAAYPGLRQAAASQQSSSSITEVFTGLKQANLAAQLNSLTVPGAALKLQQLAPGNMLRTAEGGSLKVLGVR
jgi:hypothetical protein